MSVTAYMNNADGSGAYQSTELVWLWMDGAGKVHIANSCKMRFTKNANGSWKGKTTLGNAAVGWLNPDLISKIIAMKPVLALVTGHGYMQSNFASIRLLR